jgi:hypothetical protein
VSVGGSSVGSSSGAILAFIESSSAPNLMRQVNRTRGRD